MAGKDGTIDVILTANATSVEQVLAKMQSALDKTVDKLGKVEQASKDSAKATEDGFSAAAGSALKFVGALTGIGSAVAGVMVIANQLRREYENMVSRQKDAANAQIGFETQLAETVRNAAGLLTGDEIKQRTIEIAGQVNADQSAVAAALSSTLSAVGPKNKAEAEQAFEATRASMQFAPEMGGADVAALAGTAVDIAKRTGATPAQAIGFMQNIGGVARVPSLQNLSGNVAPAVMSVSQFGGSMQEAGGLVSALTQGMADTEGRISGTAAIGLAEQLRERLPGMGSTAERIAAIQGDPAKFKAFFQGGRFGSKKFEPASFEKKALASVEQLLTPGTMMARAFTEGTEKIGDVQGAGQATYDDLMKQVNSVTFASRLKRTFGTATSEQQILDTVGGQTSISREGLKGFLKGAGQSQFEQDFESVLFEGNTMTGGLPVDVASQRLKRGAESLRAPKALAFNSFDQGQVTSSREANESELKSAKALENLAKALDSLSTEMKQNTEATRQNNKENPPQAPKPITVPSAALGRP